MMKSLEKRILTGSLALLFAAGTMAGCTKAPAPASDAPSVPDSAPAVSAPVDSAAEASMVDIDEDVPPIAALPDVQEELTIDLSSAAAFADALLIKPAEPEEEPLDPDNLTPFVDVDHDAYYYEPLLWALDNEVVTGSRGEEFRPDDPCSRGDTVTLLYAVGGRPEVDIEDYPFDDVAQPNSQQGKAIAWAAEEGITNGNGDGSFDPDGQVTRLQAVTFLWRLAGSPNPSDAETLFWDADQPAVHWAVEQGITSGTSEGEFSPDTPCTRGQVITFIYRYAIGAGIEFTRTHMADIPEDRNNVGMGSEKPGTVRMVSLNIPAMYVGDKTQADVDALALTFGIQGAVLNQDGSMILKMSESVQQHILETIRGNISQALNEIPNSEWYPDVTDVYADDAYTVFTVQTSLKSAEEAKNIPLSEFVLYSWIYACYSGQEIPSVLVIVANESTGEIYREARATQPVLTVAAN